MGNKVVGLKKLKDITLNLLARAGEKEAAAIEIYEHLLEQEILGKTSHGFYRLPSIINCIKNRGSRKDIRLEKNGNVLSVDGMGAVGVVAVKEACNYIINSCNSEQIMLTSVTGYVGTTGAMGYYTRFLANNNLISIIFCNSEYAVAPWGGMDAIIGTNPISIGIPNKPMPVVVDFATSAKTYGELMLAVKNNISIPKGIVLDVNGYPSTDPDDANNGCQLPMAEHKGYALGLIIEILAGLFIGAKSGKDSVSGSDGTFILTFKPNLFVNEDVFNKNLNAFLDEVRFSHVAPGFSKIRIPGEYDKEQYEKVMQAEEIELDEKVYEDIISLT